VKSIWGLGIFGMTAHIPEMRVEQSVEGWGNHSSKTGAAPNGRWFQHLPANIVRLREYVAGLGS